KTRADNGFPPHLQDLVDLHRAFVKTMMLQMAHNGNNVPVDVRDLGPNVARAWRKRQVTVEDIRRCIAIQAASDETSSPFIVTDYGRGKVCVELDSRHAGVSVDQDKLCKQF